MSLASVRVDVAAFARHGQPPHHLHATLSCIKSSLVLTNDSEYYDHMGHVVDEPAASVGDTNRPARARRGGPRRRAGGAQGWQLDVLAGVHHMSDGVVNGPRKGVEQFSARFREWNTMRCGG